MSWPFDTTTPHVTPEDLLAYQCRREGFERQQLALPSVMVATFQRASYARLVEETAADLPPGLQDRAVAGGTGVSGIESLLVGRLPRSKRPVAVTRFGVGAPATTLTMEVALARGVRTVLVCGSAGSLQPSLPLGSLVVVTASEREDGTSHHYLPAGEIVSADPVVTDGLTRAARELGLSPTEGRSWTIDAPFRETAGAIARHRAAGVAVVEMEAAAIFAVARVRDARAGLIVAVSDELFQPWNPGFHLPEYLEALTRAADAILLAAEPWADEHEVPGP
jgi:purine-nucleoside phosphorylase